MGIPAAASHSLRSLLRDSPSPVTTLGTGPRALYLQARGEVMAVLSADATWLPCAVLLPTTAAELPLTRLGDGLAIGAGQVLTQGGPITVRRWWAPARVRSAADPPRDLGPLLGFPSLPDTGVDEALVEALTGQAVEAAAALLGRGPGLTPAGDDVLAGFLLAARALAVPAGPVREFVAAHAGDTTALSARLLRHALAGECVPELAAALDQRDLAPLLRVGHTSGPALARGLLRAAELVRRPAARSRRLAAQGA